LPSQSRKNHQLYQEFTVRLIRRTIFCWFLKKKKSSAGEALLPENLLSSQAVKDNPNYYHTILEKIFFQTLNTPMDQRVKTLPRVPKTFPSLMGGSLNTVQMIFIGPMISPGFPSISTP